MGNKKNTDWPQLYTEAIFGKSADEAVVLGKECSDMYSFNLKDTKEINECRFVDAKNSWTSTNGTSYIASRPIVAYKEGDWYKISSGDEAPSSAKYVGGFSGESPLEDTLFCLFEMSLSFTEKKASLHIRKDDLWHCEDLGPYSACSIAASKRNNTVYIGLGHSHGRNDCLVKWQEGKMEKIVLPVEHAVRVENLLFLENGSLLAAIATIDKGKVSKNPGDVKESNFWLLENGEWTRIECPVEIMDTYFYLDSVLWNGNAYVATKKGILKLNEKEKRFELVNKLESIKLYNLNDSLICRGAKKGTWWHEITSDGTTWEPLMIPEPDMVYGGKERMIVDASGKKYKVPITKKKHKSFKAAPPKQKEILPTLENYYPDMFFNDMKKSGAEKRSKAIDLVQKFSKELGINISKHTALYLDFIGKNELDFEFGLTCFDNVDWKLSVDGIYNDYYSMISYFSNTLFIGSDGGGQGYFVELSENSSEVYLYDPGTGEFSFIADSIASFFYLNKIWEIWERLSEEFQVDYDEVEEGEFNPEDFKQVINGVKELKDHVNLTASSDFDEILTMISGVTPTASSKTTTHKLYERAEWLIMHFEEIYTGPPKFLEFSKKHSEKLPPSADKIYWLWHLFLLNDPNLESYLAECEKDTSEIVNKTAGLIRELTKEKVPKKLTNFLQKREEISSEFKDEYKTYFNRYYFSEERLKDAKKSFPQPGKELIEKNYMAVHWLWHYYFLNDKALEPLLQRCSTHPDSWVTDTVSFIKALLNEPDAYTEFNYLRLQRELMKNRKLPPVFDKKFDKSFLDVDKGDNSKIKAHKEYIKKNLNYNGGWNNLTYNYYEIEDWGKMLFCAERSIAVNPDHYYAWMQRGIAFNYLKNNEEALRSYDRGQCFANDSTEGNQSSSFFINKAVIIIETGDEQKTMDHLRQMPDKSMIKSCLEDFKVLEKYPEYLGWIEEK